MAAAWAEHHFAEQFVFADIRSAGIHALPGYSAGAYALDAMRELGFDMRTHRSQLLTAELLGWADFAIVMEPEHAAAAEHICSETLPEEEWATIIPLWNFAEDGFDHIPDPEGGPLDDYREAARAIGSCIEKLVAKRLSALQNPNRQD